MEVPALEQPQTYQKENQHQKTKLTNKNSYDYYLHQASNIKRYFSKKRLLLTCTSGSNLLNNKKLQGNNNNANKIISPQQSYKELTSIRKQPIIQSPLKKSKPNLQIEQQSNKNEKYRGVLINNNKLYTQSSKEYLKGNPNNNNGKKMNSSPIYGSVSATSWIIYDSNTQKSFAHKQNLQKEVASLTKMMTCIVALDILKKYQIDKNVILRVSKTASAMIGTSANLKNLSWIKLIDLLYGLMLPSGNDAAMLLAQNFGLLIFYQKLKPKQKKYSDIQSIDITNYENTIHFVNQFVKQMNKKAKQIGMHNTSFTNPHGLPNNLNYSTAKDMLLLSRHCQTVPQFMKITSTKIYNGILYLDTQQIQCIQLEWKNTNKLLDNGWQGLKTGLTLNAGGCLASFKFGIFIIVLNCSNAQKRFEDTLNLFQWYNNELNIKNIQKA